MLTGVLVALQYDSVSGDYESDSDFHDDIDYAYGRGRFGHVGEFAKQ
jgi:hypothetical protein